MAAQPQDPTLRDTRFRGISPAKRRDRLVERLIQSSAGVFEIFSVYIGHRLGYYQHLPATRGVTSAELAQRSGAHERYTREWLEQQTVIGILRVENPNGGADERRYSLPAGHDEVLVQRESDSYMIPLAQLLAAVTRPVEALVQAYQQGGGVAFSDYGADMVFGQGDFNRPVFLNDLGTLWLPAMPDVHTRLQAQPPARVADIGCGTGWSCIGMARAYPLAQVDGFDLDETSVKAAQQVVEDEKLSERVHIQVRDAADPSLGGQYDLVTAFECIHDMSDPVQALASMRRLVRPGGAVLVVDERVGEKFSPQGTEVEWMMYGWSLLHCLPVGMAQQPSAATGTVMRPETLRGYALAAGFREVEILAVENTFLRLYRLWL